jgi:uncharacterized protein YbjT (DUF2867 family)
MMILVTGATGTVGSETLRQLAAAGLPARALVRNPQKAAGLLPVEIELVPGDFDDAAALDRAFSGADAALFIAPGDPAYPRWCEAFAAAAQRAGGTRVVKLSAMQPQPDSPAEILRQHAQTDAMLRASGLPVTLLQPNSFYQNMLGQAAAIKAEGRFYMAMGEARQSFVDVRDVAAAAVKTLSEDSHAGQTYHLTGPESLSLNEVAAQLSEVLGREASYVPISSESFRQALQGMGLPEWTVGALVDLVAVFARGVYAGVEPDCGQLLGRAPITFRRFVADFAPAFS